MVESVRGTQADFDEHQDFKRPPVRGGVGPSGSASPFFVSNPQFAEAAAVFRQTRLDPSLDDPSAG
jgi:hypothetical protein